ncbi:MAG: hypothetical protein RR334_01030 [Clostridia bacterium]
MGEIKTQTINKEKDVSTDIKAVTNKEKWVSSIGYLGFTFFIPLLVCSHSVFCTYHANQALVLFIITLAGSAMVAIISGFFALFKLWVFGVVIGSLFGGLIIMLMINGIVNVSKCLKKPLPVIGKVKILK